MLLSQNSSNAEYISSRLRLHTILDNLGNRLDMVYELQDEDSTVVCLPLFLHLLVIRDFESQALSYPLTHRVENVRKVHRLKWFQNGGSMQC